MDAYGIFVYTHIRMTVPVADPVAPLTVALKALSEDTRVRIVGRLAGGERCVCHLEASLQLPQPTVSRHLAVLRSAGLVVPRRAGSWVYYSLAAPSDAGVARVIAAVIEAVGAVEPSGEGHPSCR